MIPCYEVEVNAPSGSPTYVNVARISATGLTRSSLDALDFVRRRHPHLSLVHLRVRAHHEVPVGCVDIP